MRLGRRSKLAFELTLSVMIGIGLLAIPVLLSLQGNSVVSPSLGDNKTSPTGLTTSTSTSSSNPVTMPLSPSQASLDVRDFAVKLTLVFALAVVLSTLVMVWSNRRFGKPAQASN